MWESRSGLHNLSGQPVPVFGHIHNKKVLPGVQMEPHKFQCTHWHGSWPSIKYKVRHISYINIPNLYPQATAGVTEKDCPYYACNSNFGFFSLISQEPLEKAQSLALHGEQLIQNNHYAVDSIRPKCVELRRICDDFTNETKKKYDILGKSLELHKQLDKVSEPFQITALARFYWKWRILLAQAIMMKIKNCVWFFSILFSKC